MDTKQIMDIIKLWVQYKYNNIITVGYRVLKTLRLDQKKFASQYDMP